MKKILFLSLLIYLSSCTKMVDRVADNVRTNVRVESVENISINGFSTVDMVLKVANNSKYKLALDNAALTLFYGGSRVGEVILQEGIDLPKGATTRLSFKFRFKVSNPLTLLAMTREFKERRLDNMQVSFNVSGKGGGVPVRFSGEMVPLSQFIATFGTSIDDLYKINK